MLFKGESWKRLATLFFANVTLSGFSSTTSWFPIIFLNCLVLSSFVFPWETVINIFRWTPVNSSCSPSRSCSHCLHFETSVISSLNICVISSILNTVFLLQIYKPSLITWQLNTPFVTNSPKVVPLWTFALVNISYKYYWTRKSFEAMLVLFSATSHENKHWQTNRYFIFHL